jgi:SAM-dependent methyltransferase
VDGGRRGAHGHDRPGLPTDAAALPLADGAFDLVVSMAVLEHVRDPAAALRETARVLVPGGTALHAVDLRDHRDFDRPREFLRDDDAAWAARFVGREENHEFTNRARRSELVAAARAAGLEVLRDEVTQRAPVGEAERAALAPRFRGASQDDLEALSVQLLLRRPGAP